MSEKVQFDNRDRKQLVDAGFNYAGNTTDETAVAEIKRDYSAIGFEIVFRKEHGLTGGVITYWTKGGPEDRNTHYGSTIN